MPAYGSICIHIAGYSRYTFPDGRKCLHSSNPAQPTGRTETPSLAANAFQREYFPRLYEIVKEQSTELTRRGFRLRSGFVFFVVSNDYALIFRAARAFLFVCCGLRENRLFAGVLVRHACGRRFFLFALISRTILLYTIANNVQAFLFLILLRNIINKGFHRVYFYMRESDDFLLIEKAIRRRS